MYSRKYYLAHKEKIIKESREWDKKNPEKAKQIHKKAFNKFRKEKPERFKELMREGYKRNKIKWQERAFVQRNIPKIMKILGQKCRYCEKFWEEMHHTKYDNLPRARNHNPTRKEFDKLLAEYCKFLIPVCQKHHQQLEKEKKEKK